MSRTPLIALVADRKPSTTGPWVDIMTDGLPHSYLTALEQAGGAPVLIPALDVHLESPERLLDGVDGLFLPGGRDLDAELYGQDPHETNDEPLRVRDEIEIALVREARRRGMPVFGACRGLQVLNVAMGGTLTQHLGDDVDLTPHRDVVGVFTSHVVEVEPGTVLEQIVGRRQFDIASHHHQGVGRVGADLVVSATAPDGVIEALESADDSFCVGVQWHPEERLDPEGLDLVRAFVRAAQEYAAEE